MNSAGSVGGLVPERTGHDVNSAGSVHVKTLGCKVNQAESERVATSLLDCGIRIAPACQSSVIIVNTCSVTAEADRKARKAIRRALSSPSAPTVVVTGCLAALDPDGLSRLGDRVVVERDRERVAEMARTSLGVDTVESVTPDRSPIRSRARVAVKVQDGCAAGCAYCVVPLARGLPRSVERGAVLREVEALVSSGVAEVVLTGINLGQYRCAGATLSDLVRAVASTGVQRLRLSSVEPLSLSDDLIETLASTPQLCPHLHIPLQSGSDAVLLRMNRGYDSAEYTARVGRLREAVPEMAVTTDVMAGFPGETDADHMRTLAVVREVGFARLHVFRYSSRAGTAAARLPEQVDAASVGKRAAHLRAEDVRLRQEYADRRRGQVAEVLVERITRAAGGQVRVQGTTEDYLKVRFMSETPLHEGQTVFVRLHDLDGDEVLATQASVAGRGA